MKRAVGIIAGALIFWCGVPASAHQLDEYLQAATISVAKDHVQVEMRLTPGVAVFPTVLAGMDTDKNGIVSAAEQRAYAVRVASDVSLTVDGEPLPLRVVSATFAKTADMKEGRGESEITFAAAVPRRVRARTLVFENHHQRRIAAYLVNCLVPRDPDIHVTAQTRDYHQSRYQLNYGQSDAGSPLPAFTGSTKWLERARWAGVSVFLLFGSLTLLWRQAARK